jgi:hypothetical protein
MLLLKISTNIDPEIETLSLLIDFSEFFPYLLHLISQDHFLASSWETREHYWHLQEFHLFFQLEAKLSKV